MVQALLALMAAGLPAIAVFVLTAIAAMATVVILVASGWQVEKVLRSSLAQVPASDVLLDIGQALLNTLKHPSVGLIGDHLDERSVSVKRDAETGNVEVMIDFAPPEDSMVFSQAFRELMGPIGDARYLIERDCSELGTIHQRLWLQIRKWLRMPEAELKDYHRVPDVLASRREQAELLAGFWRQYVGGGRLVYTRAAEGQRILLEARSRRRRRIRQMAFEFWE
jgi:hypothetical protein